MIYLLLYAVLCMLFYQHLQTHKKQNKAQKKARHEHMKQLRHARCEDPELRELSGLEASHSSKGVFWAHNDSLDQPRLFAINEHGQTLSHYEIPQASNIDWEDIALVSHDFSPLDLIYIADSGNNFHWRDQLSIYVVEEPLLSQSTLASSNISPQFMSVLAKYDYQFPKQTHTQTPIKLEDRCLDAEAIFWAHNDLWLIAKCFWGGKAPLYKVPIDTKQLAKSINSQTTHEDLEAVTYQVTLQHTDTLDTIPALADYPNQVLARTPFQDRVTAADYHSSSKQLAILTYSSLLIFESEVGLHSKVEWTRTQVIPLNMTLYKQVEALTWINENKIMIGNEQRNLFIFVRDYEGKFVNQSPLNQPLLLTHHYMQSR